MMSTYSFLVLLVNSSGRIGCMILCKPICIRVCSAACFWACMYMGPGLDTRLACVYQVWGGYGR